MGVLIMLPETTNWELYEEKRVVKDATKELVDMPNKDLDAIDNPEEMKEWKFLQLPKARQNLIDSYKDDLQAAIQNTKIGAQIIESGTRVMTSYEEPFNKLMDTGTNIVATCKEPVGTMIATCKQPVDGVKKIFESGSSIVGTQLAAIPGVGRFLPWRASEENTEGNE